MFYLQDKPGLDYNDPVAIDAEVPLGWWLRDDSCKYILSVFVHKDNKDISARPTKLPPGPTCALVREMAKISMTKERFEAREQQRPVSLQRDGSVDMDRYGEVEYQSKKAKVEGMRSVIDKNRVDALMTHIIKLLLYVFYHFFLSFFVIAFCVFIYGIIIEVCQMLLTTYREADVYDMLANLGGMTSMFLPAQ